MLKSLIHSFFLFFLINTACGQEYSYVHYETRDGLAGSTVYDICQDRDGFMWFATENGISRYDGTNFKNFTTKEGLPDNEVLKIFADTKGRVWICTFSKSICYYYKGKIYDKSNDPALAQIHISNTVVSMAEDDDGNVIFCDISNILWIINDKHQVRSLDVFGKGNTLPLKFVSVFSVDDNNRGKKISVSINDTNYTYHNGELVFRSITPSNFYFSHYKTTPVYRNPATFLKHYVSLHFEPINIIYSYWSLMFITSANGCYAIDTLHDKLGAYFLPGKKISYVLEDNEGNTWFSTLGEGVYKLPSIQFKTHTLANNKSPETFCIAKTGKSIAIGAGFSSLFQLTGNDMEKKDFASLLENAETKTVTNRLVDIQYCSGSNASLLGFDSYLLKLQNNQVTVNPMIAIKSIAELPGQNVLVGTARGAYVVAVDNMKTTDTVWKSRSTKVLYHANKYYIGTLNGLYEVSMDKSNFFMGTIHPLLQRRITDIVVAPDNTMWISTHDRGIIGLRDKKIIKVISTEDELSSDNCKSLFLHNNDLWVGTNKGVNRIDLRDTGYSITKYSVSDGLISDNVNGIYVEDSMVYVCTAKGLSYFNEKQINASSKCNLQVLKVQVSGKNINSTGVAELNHNDNNISFEFVGISFKSEGDLTYRYRLDGLNSSWKETRLNIINYPTLPSGTYTFQLVAINKFGVQSQLYSFNFMIATPWWRSLWFWILTAVAGIAAVWFFINMRYKILNKRREEKILFKQRIADLEQLSLRAQMNPHFIFNCLNSIQNFIINRDLEATNRYMNNFARILRLTLDQSSHKVTSVAEEITYITTYLELEKMRFGEQFGYTINVSDNLSQDFTFMPNMILQPFVENSIRHGMLYRKEGGGMIEIDFIQTATTFECIVKDNGIGRKRSLENKTDQHIEYHSKGMELTFNRLELLEGTGNDKVHTIITDAYDDKEYPGTSVKIIFPISIIDKLNKQR